MELKLSHPWNLPPAEARALQQRLQKELVLKPPPGLVVERVAGADISMDRGSDRGFGAIVTLDARTLKVLTQTGVEEKLNFPYIPGLLSFRELPVLAAAWERMERAPDVVIFDGHGTAHPRHFGIACHGGLLFGVPSIGCGKSILVGRHGPLGEERGSTAPMEYKGEVVGMAVRTRTGVNPVYVSPGNLMDLPTAVEIVLAMAPKYREPETTRRAHRLVNELRIAGSD